MALASLKQLSDKQRKIISIGIRNRNPFVTLLHLHSFCCKIYCKIVQKFVAFLTMKIFPFSVVSY